MTSQKKIQCMIRLAMLEKEEGTELQKLQDSFRSDYIGIPMLKNALRITAAYGIGLACWIFFRLSWILQLMADNRLRLLLTGIMASYVSVLLLTLLVTFWKKRKEYKRHQRSWEVYQGLLQECVQLGLAEEEE